MNMTTLTLSTKDSTSHVTLDDVATLPRLKRLTIHLHSRRWIGLAALARAPTLEYLCIIGGFGLLRLTADEVAEVRALGHLRSCLLYPLQSNEENMIDILAPPHTLKWQEISAIFRIPCVRALSSLPSLTKLEVFNHVVSRDILSQFPHLQRLQLWGHTPLKDALLGCPQLTELELNDCGDSIRDTLSHVPLLRTLRVRGPRSLSWMETPSLRQSLTLVYIDSVVVGGKRLPFSELDWILKLDHLHALCISRLLFQSGFQYSGEWAALQVPSAALPTLKRVTVYD
jgi:hypothetical protein